MKQYYLEGRLKMKGSFFTRVGCNPVFNGTLNIVLNIYRNSVGHFALVKWREMPLQSRSIKSSEIYRSRQWRWILLEDFIYFYVYSMRILEIERLHCIVMGPSVRIFLKYANLDVYDIFCIIFWGYIANKYIEKYVLFFLWILRKN